LLIANGRHIEEVKDYLGHSSIRTTSDRYAHLFPRARAELADALDATFRISVANLADFSRTARRSRVLRTRIRGARSAPDLQQPLERTTGFEPATLTLAR
jgi:hypothetical protein